jgi:hypothetical protein
LSEERRAVWHLSTLGYTMEKDPSTSKIYASIPPPPPPILPEDFTDDDPSDLSESGSEDEEGTGHTGKDGGDKKKKRPGDRPKKKQQVRDAFNAAVGIEPEELFKDIPEGWDPSQISPIFFGYKTDLEKDVKAAAAAKAVSVKESEDRAIERAMKVLDFILLY